MKIFAAILWMLLVSSAAAETFRGHLFIGPENETFYPCENSKGYWFLAPNKVQSHLVAEGLKKSSALSEQGVFVELAGKVGRKTKTSDGDYASTYPAFFHIQKVISISEVSKSDCQR